MTKQPVIARSIIVVLYVALTAVMFVTGRTHTVLIDNHGAEDGSYAAIREMEISVNGQKPVEFFRNDRDMFSVQGQTLRISVDRLDGSAAETYRLSIPLAQDMVLVSIPKLTEGIEPALEPFNGND